MQGKASEEHNEEVKQGHNAPTDILKASECTTDEKEKAFLLEIMDQKEFDTVLKYRASRDGWMAKDFHARADGVKPSLSLFKTKKGVVIGGFTTAAW